MIEGILNSINNVADPVAAKQSREMPHNINAEQGLLGALLNNNEYFNKIGDFLLQEHFYLPLHAKIYQNIIHLIDRNLIANPITLKSLLDQDETLKELGVGGFDYLVKLSAAATSIINVESFARVIYETAIRRMLIQIGEDIVNDSFEENLKKGAEAQIEAAEQKLFELAIRGTYNSRLSHIRNVLHNTLQQLSTAMKKGHKVNGVPTGFVELDNYIGGMHPSDLIIIAARPSMGKTSLAVNIGLNAADRLLGESKASKEKPKSVGIFSLEMSAEQIVTRMLSMRSKVRGTKIRLCSIGKEDFVALSRESSYLNELPIFIDDTAALSISALRTKARRLRRQHNLGLIIVDYLQLMTSKGTAENRVNEIGEISQGLKAIAKELEVPVIALSQLSRAVESREDKKPQLSDLRESGNIEQDADVVMFIYREEYYMERKKPSEEEKRREWQTKLEPIKNIAEIMISKQRNGPVGSVFLRFDSDFTSFANLDVKRVGNEASI
ncbi:replicative DNA helicase [Rickettsiales endosymbiont of Peranema trichophorum]|uniref:replicative DNA helicase n=1 Tax=Rickettsiales endosymbiont of Peranema trichophorum TaxID=2486577 RepID=UPI0010231337|nr:replicative DNA helicase [Rickettsiales endosymbiont of Peranema trichophorum]